MQQVIVADQEAEVDRRVQLPVPLRLTPNKRYRFCVICSGVDFGLRTKLWAAKQRQFVFCRVEPAWSWRSTTGLIQRLNVPWVKGKCPYFTLVYDLSMYKHSFLRRGTAITLLVIQWQYEDQLPGGNFTIHQQNLCRIVQQHLPIISGEKVSTLVDRYKERGTGPYLKHLYWTR